MIRTPSAPGELKTYRNVSETAEHCSVRSVLSFQGEISRIFCTIYIYIHGQSQVFQPQLSKVNPNCLKGVEAELCVWNCGINKSLFALHELALQYLDLCNLCTEDLTGFGCVAFISPAMCHQFRGMCHLRQRQRNTSRLFGLLMVCRTRGQNPFPPPEASNPSTTSRMCGARS